MGRKIKELINNVVFGIVYFQFYTLYIWEIKHRVVFLFIFYLTVSRVKTKYIYICAWQSIDLKSITKKEIDDFLLRRFGFCTHFDLFD